MSLWTTGRTPPGDENDYYYHTLPEARAVDVVVNNYEPTSAHEDLLVYGPADGDLRGPLAGQFGNSDYSTEMRIDNLELKAGKYYVLVYTDQPIPDGQLYTLRLSYWRSQHTQRDGRVHSGQVSARGSDPLRRRLIQVDGRRHSA